MATPTTKEVGKDEPAVMLRPYEQRRLAEAEHSMGPLRILTLPGAERIDEGPQNATRFGLLGEKLHMGGWLIVTNDAGSFWALMRVEAIHGGAGHHVRALSLRYITPPCTNNKTFEEPVSTGEFYIRYGGSFHKWQVIAPNGQVRQQEINTEAEARLRCDEHRKNAKAFASR
jgi:hypothetical protein